MANLPQTGVEMVAKGVNGFIGDVKRGGDAVGAFGQVVTGALREIGALATQALADAGRAAAGFLKDSIGQAGDVEQTLAVLGATSGATAEELKAVSDKATELGADLTLPATSAAEAAEVMLELSKAGFSVQEAMDAAKGSLQLAAAAQVDGATAATIMAGAINAFELSASDAAHVADLLAGGANASSASMTDLSAGLQQAGFAMHNTGQSIDDTVTALAALTNVGLTGSDAGTALKNAMMRLQNPTEKAAKLMASMGLSAYDSQGNMKPFPQLLDEINAATAGMTNEQRDAALGTIFLSDGMKAMIPLLNLGSDGFAALRGQVAVAGSAADVAGAQMQGWNGAMAGLQSQVETLQLVIGQQLLPVLTPLVQKFAEGVGKVTEFVAAFAPMIPTIASANDPFRALLSAISIINPGFAVFAGLILQVYKPLRATIDALMESGVQSQAFAGALQELLVSFGLTGGQAAQVSAAIQQIAGWITGTAIPAVQTFAGQVVAAWPQILATAQTVFDGIMAKVNEVLPYISSFIETTLTFISAVWQTHGATILQIASGAWTAIEGIIKTLLGAIQGAMAIATAVMTGDWQSGQQAMQQSSELIWGGISQFLTGILEIIAGAFGTSLSGIAATWDSNFNAFATIAETLMGKAQSAIQGALDAIGGAFSGITDKIGGAIQAVKDFISAAAKIVVPDLVTPGSPSPLETGMYGVASAFQAASAASASFPAMPNMAAAGMSVSGSVGVNLSMGSNMGWLDARIDNRIRAQTQAGASRGRV